MIVKKVAVFCGSSFGNDFFKAEAEKLAHALGKLQLDLVYGAGERGLMGVVASTMKKYGVHITGITPKRFAKSNEGAFEIDEYITVDNMHTRKKMMYQKADAFIILPGGVGTLEEFSECFTWRQIGMLNKPIVLYNLNNFYDPLIKLFDNMKDNGFLREDQREKLFASTDIDEIMAYFNSYERVKGAWEE